MTTSNGRICTNAWLQLKDHPQCCQQWKESFYKFCRDVGKPPERATPLKLIHLDTLKEIGPGNVAWMDRLHYQPHVRFEKHRQLMVEINHPVPPYVAPKVFFDPPCSQGYVIPTDREVRLAEFREDIVEMRKRQTTPRKEVIKDPLDILVFYHGRLITIRKRMALIAIREKEVQRGRDKRHAKWLADAPHRLAREQEAREAQEKARSLMVEKERQRRELEELERPSYLERCESVRLCRQREYDIANPRWMALKIVPAEFDGTTFKCSPFEAVSEDYDGGNRVLAMLKEGGHKGLVKVIPQEGTSHAQFGIEHGNYTTWAHTGDYIAAVRYHDGYRIEVIFEQQFKSWMSTINTQWL